MGQEFGGEWDMSDQESVISIERRKMAGAVQ